MVPTAVGCGPVGAGQPAAPWRLAKARATLPPWSKRPNPMIRRASAVARRLVRAARGRSRGRRCRRRSTPRSIISAASARRGSGAKTARRTRASRTRSAPSKSIRAGPQGLTGLETVSHVLLLYWMDKARRDLVLQSPRHYTERRGTFALRSPARPNPIAASVARLAPHRRQQALGRRPRLPRQHAAARHQAVFCLDRFRAGRAGRLAQQARKR